MQKAPSQMFDWILDTLWHPCKLYFEKIRIKIQYFTTAQKLKLFIKELVINCDQIRRFLRTWPHLMKKSLMENFISCTVLVIHRT